MSVKVKIIPKTETATLGDRHHHRRRHQTLVAKKRDRPPQPLPEYLLELRFASEQDHGGKGMRRQLWTENRGDG